MAKNVYIISPNGSIIKFTEDEYNEMLPEDMKKLYEEIGNKFEKKSDAKLVVKKFKAWKRLKDKGFEFKSFVYDSLETNTAIISIKAKMDNNKVHEDLELLFGRQ